jgi:hypothetical protein
LLIDAVTPACNNEHRLIGIGALKYQGFGNLLDLATDCRSSIFRGASGLRQHDDSCINTFGFQYLLDGLGGVRKLFSHAEYSEWVLEASSVVGQMVIATASQVLQVHAARDRSRRNSAIVARRSPAESISALRYSPSHHRRRCVRLLESYSRTGAPRTIAAMHGRRRVILKLRLPPTQLRASPTLLTPDIPTSPQPTVRALSCSARSRLRPPFPKAASYS